jgi:hypothetical protein
MWVRIMNMSGGNLYQNPLHCPKLVKTSLEPY